MPIVDKNYFPGWTRKSITFSIDDGNVLTDKIWLGYVNPAGIRGTFNLCSHNFSAMTPAEYRDFYRGHEIANHVKQHPFVLNPEKEYHISDEKWPVENPDTSMLYQTDVPNLYIGMTHAWRSITTPVNYLRFVREGKAELESVFGEGTVKDFVWPFSEQPDHRVFLELIAMGYRSIRKTGNVRDTYAFNMPADRFRWSYNVSQGDLGEYSAKYAALPDDGNLKFFCLGVHSVDYENAGQWGALADFCRDFGNRPGEYYSAPVGELFAYEDAVKNLAITEFGIANASDIDVFVKVDGKRVIVRAHQIYAF